MCAGTHRTRTLNIGGKVLCRNHAKTIGHGCRGHDVEKRLRTRGPPHQILLQKLPSDVLVYQLHDLPDAFALFYVRLSAQRVSPRRSAAAVHKSEEEYPNKTPSVAVVLHCYRGNWCMELRVEIKGKKRRVSAIPRHISAHSKHNSANPVKIQHSRNN